MTNHLATFNVFRENDGDLYVTVADAHGVKMELGPTQLPLHPMAMKVLFAAVRRTRDRQSKTGSREPGSMEAMLEAAYWAYTETSELPYSEDGMRAAIKDVLSIYQEPHTPITEG